ncbi:hypothetical protein [Undibacterium sp. Ren11W]|uniref:hypothetical protein n=1 Tax=Undibacterium sp. Ren11W TaxID=3413045 RepID=UPI003BF13DE1
MKKHSIAWIYLAGVIALIGAAIHLAAIFSGAGWYRFFGAPPLIVESARSGTLLAPVGAMLIAALMGLCAAYAFSALGLIRRMPLLRLMLAGMASVCLVRSFVLLPLSIFHPELRNTFEVVAAVVWGLAGMGFLVGYYHSRLVTTKNAAVNAAVNAV